MTTSTLEQLGGQSADPLPSPLEPASEAASRPRWPRKATTGPHQPRTTPSARRSPIERDASSMMLSTVAAAALNLAFWLLAAHLYDVEAVGAATAAVAGLTLMAGFAQLNLYVVLLRLLPVAGRRTINVLRISYVAIAVASLLFGAGFLLLGAHGQMFTGLGAVIGAVALVLVFALFLVQDSALIALGRATWVPLLRIGSSAAKLVLLLVLAEHGTGLSLTLAWAVPMVGAVLVGTWLIFKRIGPAQVREADGTDRLPATREIGTFFGAQYFNYAISNVVTMLPPVMVAGVLGPGQAAYFNVPWLIVITMQTVLWNIVMSFVVQSSKEPHRIREYAGRVQRVGLLVVTAGTLGLLVAAPLMLVLQGSTFADAGTPLLRVIALSFPCSAIVIFYSAFASIERRMARLNAVVLLGAATFFGTAVALMPELGIMGVGVAYCLAQALTAMLLLPGLVRRLRTPASPTSKMLGHDPAQPLEVAA